MSRDIVDHFEKSSSPAKDSKSVNSVEKKKEKHINDYLTKDSKGHGMSWNKFISVKNEYPIRNPAQLNEALASRINLHFCGDDLVKSLKTPALSESDYKWCQWALSSKGGNVQVRKYRLLCFI